MKRINDYGNEVSCLKYNGSSIMKTQLQTMSGAHSPNETVVTICQGKTNQTQENEDRYKHFGEFHFVTCRVSLLNHPHQHRLY